MSDPNKELENVLKIGRSFIAIFDAGVELERTRIIEWIEENRSALELEPGEYIYRDHFNSESLLEFIKGGSK